eukprot:g4843.t1
MPKKLLRKRRNEKKVSRKQKTKKNVNAKQINCKSLRETVTAKNVPWSCHLEKINAAGLSTTLGDAFPESIPEEAYHKVRLNEDQIPIVERMYKKHGTNYYKMFMDHKTNIYQWTQATCEKYVKGWCQGLMNSQHPHAGGAQPPPPPPATLENIRQALRGSISADAVSTVREESLHFLRKCEEQEPELCLRFLQIYHETTPQQFPEDYTTIKFLALTGCKNIIIRNWGYRGHHNQSQPSQTAGHSAQKSSSANLRGNAGHTGPPPPRRASVVGAKTHHGTPAPVYYTPELRQRIKIAVLEVFKQEVMELQSLSLATPAPAPAREPIPFEKKRQLETLVLLLRKMSRFSFPKDFSELLQFFASSFNLSAVFGMDIAAANARGMTAADYTVYVARKLLTSSSVIMLPSSSTTCSSTTGVGNGSCSSDHSRMNAEGLQIFQVVQLFFSVLKEQSLKMLLADKSAFHKVGQELLQMFAPFFVQISQALRLILDSPLNLKTLLTTNCSAGHGDRDGRVQVGTSAATGSTDPRWAFSDADSSCDQRAVWQQLLKLGQELCGGGLGASTTSSRIDGGPGPPSSAGGGLAQPDRARLWKLRKIVNSSMMILLEKGFVHLTELVAEDPAVFRFFRDELGERFFKLHLSSVNYTLSHDLCSMIPFLSCFKGFLKRWALLLKQHPLALVEADVARCLELNVMVLEFVYNEVHQDYSGAEDAVDSSGASSCSGGKRILILEHLPGKSDDYFRLLALLLTVARRAVEGLENCFRHGWRNRNQSCEKLKLRAETCYRQFTEVFLAKYPIFPKLTNLVAELCLKLNVVSDIDYTQQSEFSPAVLLKDALEEQDEQQLEDDQQLLTGPAQASEVRQAGERFLNALCMHENYRPALTQWIEGLTSNLSVEERVVQNLHGVGNNRQNLHVVGGCAAAAPGAPGGGMGSTTSVTTFPCLDLRSIENYDMVLSVLTVCQSLFKKVSQDRQFHEAQQQGTLLGPGEIGGGGLRTFGPKVTAAAVPMASAPTMANGGHQVQHSQQKVNLLEERQFLAKIFAQLLPVLKPAISLYNKTPDATSLQNMPAQNLVWYIVLPIRVAYFFRAWANDLPVEELPKVLEVLSNFLQFGHCKLIRMSILSPLEEIYTRHSDHTIWSQIQSPLTDALVFLLRSVTNPTTQWRCLSLVKKILEEGDGACESKAQMLQTLLGLWQADKTELMVRMALLELVQTLVQQHHDEALKQEAIAMATGTAPGFQLQNDPANILIEQLLEVSLIMLGDCYRREAAKRNLNLQQQQGGGGTAGGRGDDDARAVKLGSPTSVDGVPGSAGSHGLPTVKECKLLFLTVLRSPLLNRVRQEQWLQALMPVSQILDRDLFLEFCTLFTHYVESSLIVEYDLGQFARNLLQARRNQNQLQPGQHTGAGGGLAIPDGAAGTASTGAAASSSFRLDEFVERSMSHEWKFRALGAGGQVSAWSKPELLALLAKENVNDTTTAEFECEHLYDVVADVVLDASACGPANGASNGQKNGMNPPISSSTATAPLQQPQPLRGRCKTVFTPTTKKLCAIFAHELIPYAIRLCESKSVLPLARRYFSPHDATNSSNSSREGSVDSDRGYHRHQGALPPPAGASSVLSSSLAGDSVDVPGVNTADEFAAGMKLLILLYPHAGDVNATFVAPIFKEWADFNKPLIQQNVESYHEAAQKRKRQSVGGGAGGGGANASAGSTSSTNARGMGSMGLNQDSEIEMGIAGGVSPPRTPLHGIVRQIQLPTSWLNSAFPIQEFVLLCLAWHTSSPAASPSRFIEGVLLQHDRFLALSLLLFSLQLMKPLLFARFVLFDVLLDMFRLDQAGASNNPLQGSTASAGAGGPPGQIAAFFSQNESLAEYFFRHFFELLLDFLRSAPEGTSKHSLEHNLLKMLRHSTSGGKRGMLRVPRSEKYDKLSLGRYSAGAQTTLLLSSYCSGTNGSCSASSAAQLGPPGTAGAGANPQRPMCTVASPTEQERSQGEAMCEIVRKKTLEVIPENVIATYAPEELQKLLAGIFPVVFFWGCTLGMFAVFLRWMFFADKHSAHELDGAPGGRASTVAEHDQHHEPALHRHLVPLFFLMACPILCVLLLRYLAMALGSALALGKVDEACDTDWHAEYDAEVREGAIDEKSATAAESHDQVLHFLLLPIPENATYAECQMWIDQLLLTPPSGPREAVVQQGIQEEQALAASKNANWYTKENVVLLAMSSSGARGAAGAEGGWRTPVHDLLEQLQGRYREHFRDFCVIDAPGMFGGTDWEEGMYASRYAWGVLGAQEWLRQNRGHLGEGLLGAQSQCQRTTSVDESLIWVTCCDLSALLHRNYLPKLALDVLSQEDEMLEEELHAADGANADATRNRRAWTIHQPPVLELRGYERLPSLLRAPDLYFSLKQLSDLYYANSSLAGVSTAHGCFSVSLSLLQHPFVDGLASDAISSGGLLAAKSLLAAVWGDLRSDDSSRRERLHLLSDREKTRQRIGAALAARNRSERRLQRTGDGRVESTVDTGDDLDEQDCEDVQESSFGATEYGPLVHLRPEGPHEDGSQVEAEATEYHRTSAQGDPAFVPVPSVRVAPIWLPCNYCGMRRTGEGGGSFFEQCELYGARSRGTIEKSSYIGTASMAQLLNLLSSGARTSSSSASATPRPWSSTLRIFWRIFFHQWLRHAAIPYLLDSGLLHSLLFVYALLQIPLWSAGKEHMTVRVAAVGGAVFLAYLLATLVLCGVAWGLLHRVLQGRIHPLYTRYGENAQQPMCSTSATLACGVAGLRLRYTQKGYLRDCSASSSSLILVPRLAFDDRVCGAAPKWSSGELSIGSKIRLMFHALQDCCFSWLLSVPLFDVPAYLFVAHQFAADARTFALKGANAFAEEQDAAPRTETGADKSQEVVLSQTTKSLSSTSELMSTVWSDEGSTVTNSLVRRERGGGLIQPPSRVPTKDLHGRDVDSSVEKLYRKDDMITSELEEEDVVHFASLLRLWWKSGFSFRKLTEALKKEQERLGDEREKLLKEETETVEDFLSSTEAVALDGEQIPRASPAPAPVPCRGGPAADVAGVAGFLRLEHGLVERRRRQRCGRGGKESVGRTRSGERGEEQEERNEWFQR